MQNRVRLCRADTCAGRYIMTAGISVMTITELESGPRRSGLTSYSTQDTQVPCLAQPLTALKTCQMERHVVMMATRTGMPGKPAGRDLTMMIESACSRVLPLLCPRVSWRFRFTDWDVGAWCAPVVMAVPYKVLPSSYLLFPSRRLYGIPDRDLPWLRAQSTPLHLSQP